MIENIVNNHNNNDINYNILKNLYNISKLEEQNIFNDLKKINNGISVFLKKMSLIYEQMNNKFL